MEPPDPDPHQAPLPEKKTKKELTAKQRRDVVARLLWEQEKGQRDEQISQRGANRRGGRFPCDSLYN